MPSHNQHYYHFFPLPPLPPFSPFLFLLLPFFFLFFSSLYFFYHHYHHHHHHQHQHPYQHHPNHHHHHHYSNFWDNCKKLPRIEISIIFLNSFPSLHFRKFGVQLMMSHLISFLQLFSVFFEFFHYDDLWDDGNYQQNRYGNWIVEYFFLMTFWNFFLNNYTIMLKLIKK